MNEHEATNLEATDPDAILGKINRLYGLARLVAVVGVVISGVLLFADQIPFVHAYLYAWVFWMTMTFGCFSLLLLHNSFKTHWGRPLVRFMEAGGGAPSLFLMLVLIAPILMNAHILYPWAQEDHWKRSEILKYRHEYMNLGFVSGRTIAYFAIWILLALGLRYWSVLQDKTGDPKLTQVRSNVASGGIVILFITAMFSFTDWVMSLDIEWASSIYGIWFVVASTLTAISMFTVLMVSWGRLAPYRAALELTPRPFWRDLTDVILTAVMFWAYVSLSQFLIQWSGNLPGEVGYYSIRGVGGWRLVSILVIVGQFFVPFLCLLAPRTKKPRMLLLVALWILAMRFVDTYWSVVPAFITDQGNSFEVTLQFVAECVAATLALGGLWFTVFCNILKRASLVPSHITPIMDEEVLEHA